MADSEKRMAGQLSALESLIKRFPDDEADLREMKDKIASGKLMPGTPRALRRRQGEDPSVTRKARQLKFLEELEAQYPDKSKTILKIKHDLSKGADDEDEFEQQTNTSTPIMGSN